MTTIPACCYVRIKDDGDGDVNIETAGLELDALEWFKAASSVAPQAPASLTAAADAMDRVTLRWSLPAADPLRPMLFEVYRNNNLIAVVYDTFFTESKLEPTTAYRYTVRSQNSRSVLSAFAQADVTTPADLTGPRLLYASAIDSNTLELRFDEPLDSLSAVTKANFTFPNGVLVVSAALLADPSRVRLATTTLPVEQFMTVGVSNVKDRQPAHTAVTAGTSYRFAFIPGLVSFWRFGEYRADTVFDISGNDLHGKLLNGARCAGPDTNQALYLDGTDDGVEVANDSLFYFGRNDFTLALWMNADTLKKNCALLDKIVGSNRKGFRLIISDLEVDRLRFIRGGVTATGILSADQTLVRQTWIHVACVVAAGQVNIYANGALVGSGVLADTTTNGASPLRIGLKGDPVFSTTPFKGRMDDIVIINRAVPQATVRWLSGTTPPLKTANSPATEANKHIFATPNPFNPQTTLRLPVSLVQGKFTLKVYDLSGRQITDLTGQVDKTLARAVWNAKSVSSGVYVAKLVAGRKTLTTRVALVK